MKTIKMAIPYTQARYDSSKGKLWRSFGLTGTTSKFK
jgi:hypothetical protein